ncbi:S41 family peptidase [Oceanirhabdus sp. W0125-5]|uniref:S41 family peptidase n=1 Tax=Oceanirhabdus sp. W0125-5 TaxID=2999116 RepID=UPI0022F2B305|nr:S41 family peptidase [Oceanirhabdus sp. W0125-5]WBW94694.1 S41 family peptidase [Oceanirhabdus sp. W0125-5]
MKTNKITIIALVCSIVIISSSIFLCGNSKQAQNTKVENEINKNQQKTKKKLNRELSDEKWIEDIDYLATELPRRHKNLFFNTTQDNFQKQIEGLKKQIPYLNDNEIKVGFLKIVASVGDAHTNGYIKSEKLLPLKFYWFENNIYVINTSKKYENILYNQLVSIDGTNVDEIIQGISKTISHENSQWIKSILPRYISVPERLHGLNIVKNTDSAIFAFKDLEGNLINIDVKSKHFDENTEWVLEENENTPLYRKNSSQHYWYEYLQDSKTLYFKYNRCRVMEDRPMDEFRIELFNVLNENQAERLIIDLRNNMGGDDRYLREFIDRIFVVEKQMNHADKLFVIIGRDTFSSGVLGAMYAKENTNATLIGESTGGKPNSYGETNYFDLKNSQLRVYYSTKYFKNIDEDIDSFSPDVNIEVTLKDYIENRDPVLDRILKNRK